MRPLLIAGALALGVASAALAPAPAHAQTQPDFKKAAEHYKAGEAAMAADLYLDAAREYAIAYEITRDPVLFFKIATANDKGGKCAIAVTYYRRYLKEGKPDDEYKKLTEQRIAVCEGTTSDVKGGVAPAPSAPAPAPEPAATTPAPTPAPAPPVTAPLPPASSTEPAADAPEEALTGTAAEPIGPVGKPAGPSALTSAGWIAIGVGAAAATVGAVMALSGNSTEQDIEDLQAAPVGSTPAEFDRETRERYEELIDEGDRFNTLAIVSFSVAGAAVVTSGVLFYLGHRANSESDDTALRVTPSLTPDGATVTAGWRF